jgi:hypothetical protein
MHPPFPNSRRDVLRCQPNADGDEIDYTIRDVELPINLYAKGATRVELVHGVETEETSAEEHLAKLWNTIPNIARSIGELAAAAGTAASGEIAGIAAAAGTMGSATDKLINSIFGAMKSGVALTGRLNELTAANMDEPARSAFLWTGRLQRFLTGDIPPVVITVACRAWGRRDTTRYSLMMLAWQLCMSRLALTINSLTNQKFVGGESFNQLINQGCRILAGKKVKIEHDVAGKFVTVGMAIRTHVLGINVLSRTGINTDLGGPVSYGYIATQNLTMPAIFNAFPYLAQPFAGVGPVQPISPNNPDPTSDETITEFPPGQIPMPPQILNTLNIGPQLGVGFLNDNGTRGSYLGLTVAQQLLAPCFPSTQPIDPPIIDPQQVKGAPTNDPTNPYKSWSPFPPSTLAPPPPPPKPPPSPSPPSGP